MFKTICEFVKTPQFIVDSCSLAIDFEYPELSEAIEDIFWFNVDHIYEMV